MIGKLMTYLSHSAITKANRRSRLRSREMKYLTLKNPRALKAFRYQGIWEFPDCFKPHDINLAYSAGTKDITAAGRDYVRKPLIGDWLIESFKGTPYFASQTFLDKYFDISDTKE